MNKIILSLHRITGTVIALFFAMWFITGLVLLYHPYPRLSDAQINGHYEALPDSLPAIETLLTQQKDTLQALSIRQFQGQTLADITTADTTYTICADSTKQVMPVTSETIKSIAQQWVDALVMKIDTLHERQQWVLYSRYEKNLPIYRFFFDDAEKHQLYIDSRTAEVLQFTDRHSRFWAWAGAIPHKFYFPMIRKNVDVWETTITIGGLICLLAALSGMYVGIDALLRHRRNKKRWGSPYKKWTYKWHHIAGLIFGIFLVGWGLSGMMAMQRIPKWLVPMEGDYFFKESKMWSSSKMLPIEKYILDYRLLSTKYHDLKQVTWSRIGDIPIYRIINGEEKICINASDSQIEELTIPVSVIEKAVRKMNGKDTPFTIRQMDEYDEYYLSRTHSLPLPVYKVDIGNADKTTYYINPHNGDTKYLTQNKRAKKWVFSGIHYLNIKWLVEHPVIWTILIWTLCLGGAFVSLTGVFLGIRFLRRKHHSSR